MFDKLIESNSVEADFKPRSKYFTVSSVIVGILFLTAVVVSLYAQNLDLGTDNFDVAELLAPVAPEAPQPPEHRPQTSLTSSQQQIDVPQRRVNQQDINEQPAADVAISVTPNAGRSRPAGDFIIGNNDIDAGGPPSSTSERPTGTSSVGGSPAAGGEEAFDDSKVKVPPPPIKAASVKPPTQSLGVITGRALYLPKPAYTDAMRLMNAQGEVSVQVTVDEDGKVISSKAVSGHPILRGPAEKAALGAKFGTTYLSKVPVKVTGVIVYRFTR